MAPKRNYLSEEITHLPEDIIHELILPRLPCKPLSRFKAVSKAYQALISPDSCFSTRQSLSPSPTSTGFVYVEESCLSFFPDQDTIGIPDPSLDFMIKSPKTVKLLSSANGLLLFYIFDWINSLCVCNPATMKREIVPEEGQWDKINEEMGLAFDPHQAFKRYAIVAPLSNTSNGGIEYSFNVFKSQTGRWMYSKQRIFVSGSCYAPTRPVYAHGLLYWFCMDYLLWFDPEKDCAGTIPLPYMNSDGADQEVEAFKDGIACMCITSEGGIEVWVLTGGTQWERWYELSMNKVMQESPYNLFFGLTSDRTERVHTIGNLLTPLAFDGRNMYVAVTKCCLEKDLLFPYMETGVDENVLFSVTNIGLDVTPLFFDMGIGAYDDFGTDWEEDLLCCDMVTGRVVNTGRTLIRTDLNFRVFFYHNSMVALPPISK